MAPVIPMRKTMSDLLITHVDVLTDEGVLKNHAIEIKMVILQLFLNDSESEKVKDSAKGSTRR